MLGVPGRLAAVPDEVTLAMVGPFTGPLSAAAEAQFLGSRIHIDRVNDGGGIQGRRIRLVRADDGFDPATAIRLIEELSTTARPAALLNLIGPNTIERIIRERVLERSNLVVIGATPGTDSLRTLGSTRVFHLHASDGGQVDKLLEHLGVIGHTRVALAYQATPFGEGIRQAMTSVSKKYRLDITKEASIPVSATDATDAARALSSGRGQAYVLGLNPPSTLAFVRAMRAAGDQTPVYATSYASADLLVKGLGSAASRGIAIAQVLPNPESEATGLARAYRSDLKRFGPSDIAASSLSLTGYLAAAVAVVALRQAARASVDGLLEPVARLKTDLGGYVVDFTRGDRVGSSFVTIGVIDGAGRLRY